MSKRKRTSTEVSEEGSPAWMTTYSDLVTLLLTFFILLFSMASVDSKKFEAVAQSLRSTFMNNSAGEMFSENPGSEIVNIIEDSREKDQDKNIDNDIDENEGGGSPSKQDIKDKEEAISEFTEKVETIIEQLDLGEYVHVVDEKTSVILRIDSAILFDVGKADIKNFGRDTIKKIAELMVQLDTEIAVQGHTDNLPIKTSLFPTNWELSTKRATNVVIFLVNECKIDPARLTATGNGEFKPIAPNDTEENRQKNRRIDIVIDK